MDTILILWSGGFVSGILAGLLGIGGGLLLVPLMIALGFQPLQAIATSNVAIAITSFSGSLQNWRMGKLDFRRVMGMGLPALCTAQLGVWLANQWNRHHPVILLFAFGVLLVGNVYLLGMGKQHQPPSKVNNWTINLARIGTGGLAGIVSGLFGVGGGAIMVPLQMVWLGETIKVAVQTSLGVVVMTGVSAVIGHGLNHHVLFIPGGLLGFGGLVGAQFSTRVLPRLPDPVITLGFRSLLFILAAYMFYKTWQTHLALPVITPTVNR